MSKELFSDGLYLKIGYPEKLKKLVKAMARRWEDFCTLPQSLKDEFVFANDGLPDPGYRLRRKEESADSKEFFHIIQGMDAVFRKYGVSEATKKDPVADDFFKEGERLHAAVRDFSVSIANNLESKIPGISGQVRKSVSEIVIRFLHYFPSRGTPFAQAHFDRSGFTLHLYESHSGLQFLTYDGKWKDAPMDATSTVIFPGYKMEKLSNGTVQKVWHRVDRNASKEDGERYSMVAFVPFPDVEGYPVTARSQDEKPGYAPITYL